MHFIDFLQAKKRIIPLTNREYAKLKLGDYFTLEKLKIDFNGAVYRKNKKELLERCKEILELQLKEPIDVTSIPADKSLASIIEIFRYNQLEHTPVFLIPPPDISKFTNQEKKTPPRWEYPGRFIAYWINTFAKTYGWSLERILNLDIDIAVHLLQEIFIEEHEQKEWEYQTTPDLSFQYDESSKKSKYHPLPKPYWMNEAVDAKIEKTKIPVSLLPYGVIDISNQGVISADVQIPTENQEQPPTSSD